MKRLNRIGPNINPCGIWLKMSRYELKLKAIFTHC